MTTTTLTITTTTTTTPLVTHLRRDIFDKTCGASQTPIQCRLTFSCDHQADDYDVNVQTLRMFCDPACAMASQIDCLDPVHEDDVCDASDLAPDAHHFHCIRSEV